MTVQVSHLQNGMRVVTHAMPHVETVAIGVWVDVGARYESEAENGLSHLLEHMAFKGTERRSARRIAEEIEAVGGYLNAYTSREHTTYYARALKDDLPLALDILGDILQHSTFETHELAREREVILQEIGQAQDTPDDIVFDHLQEVAFPGQPLGRSILGTTERVSSFQREAVQAYMNAHYRARHMVLAAAGDLDHDALVAAAEDTFGSLLSERGSTFENGVYAGGEARDERALEQLHLTLGFSGFAYDDPDYYALQVFSTVLGGGMSSRLFQEVREERGLAYSVYSFASSHADSGLFGIYAGTSPEFAGELVNVVADECHKLTDSVDEDELMRARAQLKTGLMMSLESTSSRIEQMGRQMLIFDRPLGVAEMCDAVDVVDSNAIARVGARLLGGDVSLAAVGPGGTLPEFNLVRGAFK